MINVEIFSKNDRLTRCHPYERCFYECITKHCKNYHHIYNIDKRTMLPESRLMSYAEFEFLSNKGLGHIATWNQNMLERIDQ